MKITRWARCAIVTASVLAATALSGCAGFWDPVPGTGTGTNPTSGYFYVINRQVSQLAGFSFASGNSAPTPISGSPYTLPSPPNALAMSPDGSFLFASTTAGIYLYAISSNGSLAMGNNGQPISSDAAYTMQIDPTGTWLVECVAGAGRITAIGLQSGTGLYDPTLGVQSVGLPSAIIKSLAISPSGSSSPYAFVAMGTNGTAVLPFNASNANPLGAVSTIATKNSLGADNTVAVDPQNRLLYVGETAALSQSQSGGLRVFNVGSSAITEISGSPYPSGGTGPSAILPMASNVYIANSAVNSSTSGNISGFSVALSGSTYSLTAINTVTTGSLTTGLAVDSTGTYLLAVNFGGNPDLSTFTFDATTAGKLDVGPTAATGTDPVGAFDIAAAP